ncbi:hypothetical protein OSB04_001566 [Centaurea solstitialis]|uniref:SWIM-type domain-containing protein n=1 Tax=Centaurea solstitialis TaxID=347529 RepID=A0AA38U2Y1_9ASTR|nr:hypothetical protein OSB04_001566 [Centaurea solstitialis]
MDRNDEYSDIHLIEEFIEDEEEDSYVSDDNGENVNVNDGMITAAEECETFLSPGGTKYWVPNVLENVKLAVGDTFGSIEEADTAYRRYADEVGFDVRQSNRKKNKDGFVQTSGASIGGSKAHNIQAALKGGVENVGATLVDYKNASRGMITYVGTKDAQMLINLMMKRQKYAPEFFFEYKVVEGELHAIFWADEISRMNYKEFGDTISFDATYRTNRHAYNFVPFIAVDNHKRSIVVGSALISNEDAENYTWVLQAFLKAHEKQPRFVITDQCLGMKAAIPLVFTESSHRFCAWHIMDKMPGKVTMSKDDNIAFKKRINRLVWSTHIGADEFENEWERAIKEFGLEGHEWLKDIYSIRESWISAYYRDEPMSGLMRTTSRSESSHAYFRLFASFKNDLVRFLRAYDSSMEKQRNKHACLEFATRNTFPRRFSPLGIERHASKVYTRIVFFDVQKEIRKAIYFCGLDFMSQEGDLKTYNVAHKKKNLMTKVSYEVIHNVCTNIFTCECNMFVRVGLPCRHILKVLMNDGVDKIPEGFISRRWTRALIPVQVQAARARYGEIDVEKQTLINAKDRAEALKDCYGDAPEDPEVLPAAGIRNKGCRRGK